MNWGRPKNNFKNWYFQSKPWTKISVSKKNQKEIYLRSSKYLHINLVTPLFRLVLRIFNQTLKNDLMYFNCYPNFTLITPLYSQDNEPKKEHQKSQQWEWVIQWTKALSQIVQACRANGTQEIDNIKEWINVVLHDNKLKSDISNLNGFGKKIPKQLNQKWGPRNHQLFIVKEVILVEVPQLEQGELIRSQDSGRHRVASLELLSIATDWSHQLHLPIRSEVQPFNESARLLACYMSLILSL